VGVAQNVWYGLSLGSVLLLAAIGLAITFGVMGVINMAHGEMVMLGAYTTFVVQEIIRAAPGPVRLLAAIALPLAFLVTALSASPSSAASSAGSTAGRWKRCSPPGACR
jgi:urea transport system permease protein